MKARILVSAYWSGPLTPAIFRAAGTADSRLCPQSGKDRIDALKDVFEREMHRQMEEYPACGDFDPGCAFEQTQADGVELGMSQGGPCQQFVAQRVHEHIGCGMKEKTELVGGGFVTTGTVGFESDVVVFNEEFGVASVTIDFFVEILGAGLL